MASSSHALRLCLAAALFSGTAAYGQASATLGPPNPLRGKAEAIAQGQASFQSHCAQCHGDMASQPMAEAPDLRRLDSFCRRLKEKALADHCLSDVDTYFLMSVQEGKVRAGVVHMPPWRDVLSVQEIWSIRSFIETRMPDPPRRTTSVDAARAAEAAASSGARH